MKQYRSIYEFQDDYPSREAREAFVKTLTNEEIDVLVDLCNNIQGKIYYQNQKKQEVIFRYELTDAWHMAISRIEVVDGPVSFVRYPLSTENTVSVSLLKWLDSQGFGEQEKDIGQVRIDRDSLKRIRDVLDDDRLFETEELEDPYQVCVMDGYIQNFHVLSKGRNIEARGYNIQKCKEDTEHCLHSVLMIQALEKIGEILVPLGVPEQCFRLVRQRKG